MTIKAGIVAAVWLCVLPAHGAVHADSTRTLDEIEVLGIKQTPASQGTATSRFGRAAIAAYDLVAVKRLGELVPNLYTPSYGSRMTSSIYMRGLGTRIDQPAVGLSIDGVPILNKDAYDFDLPDLARIEVLRGAQSVLNGRNAMAGLINVHTLSPRDIQGLRGGVRIGSHQAARVWGGWYDRPSGKLAMSLSAMYDHAGGYWRNAFNNRPVGRENTFSARHKTVFSPSTAHTITNTLSFNHSAQSGYPYQSVATGQIAYNDTCLYRRNHLADGLTVAWAGKRVLVTSVTSVQYLDDRMTLDQDFTPADYFTLTQKRRELTITQDLFTKGARGHYGWLGGVFGFWRSTSMQAPVHFYDTGIARLIEDKRNQINPQYPISWDKRELLLASDFKLPGGGFAVYHQSTYTVNGFTLEGGLRLDIERSSCKYASDCDATYTVLHQGQPYSNQAASIHDRGDLCQTHCQLLPRLSASYALGCGTIFASFSKGYKSGGYNTQMFSDVLQQRLMQTMGLAMPYSPEDMVRYKPEWSLNYEAGIKLHDNNGRASGELTLFAIQCHDQQLTMFPPGTVTGRAMTNAGRTLSYGAEFTAWWTPLDDLQLSAAYGYTNARFRRYHDGHADYRGNRVPFAPMHTIGATAQWRTPWHPAGLNTSVNADLRGVGDIMWNEANTLRQPFYATLGGHLALAAEHWVVKLWCQNATATRYNTFYFVSMGNAFLQRGAPLTFGIDISLNFGS